MTIAMTTRRGMPILRTILLTILAGFAAGPAHARETSKVTLSSTGVEAAARGKASVSVARTSSGRLVVTVQRLARDADYELMVGGIKVLTLRTSRGGGARARFSTTPQQRDTVLGFDPRGASIVVRNGSGEDVLVGTVPETSPGGGSDAITCCVPDDRGTECEDRTAEDCAALGGQASSAHSCLPDPCGATPPADRDVVCCTPDDDGAECEDRTQAECLAAGGSIVEATSCTPNPCAGTEPPSGTPAPSATPDGSASPAPTATPAPPPEPTTTPAQPPTPEPTATTLSCDDGCWTSFFGCLNGCTSTYCAPFCQFDLGRCLDACPG